MIYSFYIFGRQGSALYYREWSRPYNGFAPDDQDEERKLVFGLLFSLKDLLQRMAPLGGSGDDSLHCLKTSNYTLHHLEVPTGVRFVITTDSATPDLRPNLLEIYSKLYTEYVVKNPSHDPTSAKPINSALFDKQLGAYIEQLSFFR